MCSCKRQENKQSLGLGHNLALLFNCQAEETVLLVGPQLARWEDIFPNVVHWDHVSEGNPGHILFGLILFHADCATSRTLLVHDLKVLKSFLRPGRTVLFFTRNFFSFDNLLQLRKSNWESFFSHRRCSFIGYKKALQCGGFHGIQSYLVLPSLDTPEEIVFIDSPLLEVPCDCNVLLRLAHRYKFFKCIADGYLFIDSCNPIEETPLLREAANHLRETGHIQNTCCRLERFDLRMRGAMVLFLSESISGKYFVVRVVNDSKTQAIVRRNEQFLQWLVGRESLDEFVKQQLPESIASFEFADRAVFIETLVNGVLAWKVNIPALREVIFQGACAFIYQLQQGTRCETKIDQNVFQELFSPVQDRLESCSGVAESFLNDVVNVLSSLANKMIGKVYIFTASHGDYGYGNILVESRSGKLTGVIDWDTGRRFEFAGVDFFNLLVQRDRIEKGNGVLQAFSNTVRDILSRNSLDASGKYGLEFNISGDTLNILLYVGFLRYVSRSAQYPQVYNTEQDEYIKILQLLKTEVPI